MSSPSSNKLGKSSLASLISSSSNGTAKPTLVPPLLKNVGQLAAGVAAVNTAIQNPISGGSATGNPRNKCALQPGHSLMDWIRLGASGKDLTGVGSQAGKVRVTLKDLAKHNTESDAWLAIRGRVFNITHYLNFHPGGVSEIMKGAGTDATDLFEQIHAWVNYEQILQKCYIGPLVAFDSSIDPEKLFNGPKTPAVSPKQSPVKTPPEKSNNIVEPVKEKEVPLPKFDWIQKSEHISIIFYTEPFSNPYIELRSTNNIISITISYSDCTFVNDIVFNKQVDFPCTSKVHYETGKLEFGFRKKEPGIWENYGVLKQVKKSFSESTDEHLNVITRKAQLTPNIFLLEMDRNDGVKIVFPIGRHIAITSEFNGIKTTTPYTPVPVTTFTNLVPQNMSTDSIVLMVKRYPDGKMSRHICDALKSDELQVVYGPFGDFDLRKTNNYQIFLMIAGGTGITPMMGLLAFLLEKRIRKSHSVRLIFGNKTLKVTPFKKMFDDIQKLEPRFKIVHVLSEEEDSNNHKTGHISKEIVEETITEQLDGTCYTKNDVFVLICGSTGFNTSINNMLNNLGFGIDQIHIFSG